jgi:hypothetical protein
MTAQKLLVGSCRQFFLSNPDKTTLELRFKYADFRIAKPSR